MLLMMQTLYTLHHIHIHIHVHNFNVCSHFDLVYTCMLFVLVIHFNLIHILMDVHTGLQCTSVKIIRNEVGRRDEACQHL